MKSSTRTLRLIGRTLSAFVVVACVLATAACSSSTSTSAPSPAATSDDAGTQTPTPAATTTIPDGDQPDAAVDPNAAACAAETANLQAGVDKSHSKTTEAVLVVKNPQCGTRVILSGSSKIDATSLHRIGSVTKSFVAGVILSLVKDGSVTLEDKVSKWVPDLKGGDGITVLELMNHTSGLFNYTESDDFLKTVSGKKYTPRELVAFSEQNPVYFAPGAGWHYSNTNYILLGMIAEAAGKSTIGALVRSRVLTKANLKATFFDGEEPIVGTLAPGQNTLQHDVTNQLDPSWSWSAGAIVAAPADVASWIEQVGSGTFYDANTQKELLTTVATDDPNVGYGLAIMVFDPKITDGAGKGIGHDGSISGYHTQAFYFPDSKTTIVSIVDSDALNPNDVSIVALDVLFNPF